MAQYGFSFRNTSGFVTDIAPNTYILGDVYPVTKNGISFVGWSSASAVDRSAGADPRFAGVNYGGAGGDITFNIDLLTTGPWTIRAAFGDQGAGHTLDARFYDDTTPLAAAISATVTADQYMDASGVTRTSQADWIANNVAVVYTFATTLFRLHCGVGGGNEGIIAYLLIEEGAGAPPSAGSGVGLFSPRGTSQPVARGWA